MITIITILILLLIIIICQYSSMHKELITELKDIKEEIYRFRVHFVEKSLMIKNRDIK